MTIPALARPPVWTSMLAQTALPIDGLGFVIQNAGLDRCYRTALNAPMHRFEVRSGDHWASDVVSDGGVTYRERSEVAQIGSYPLQTPVWMAWDFMVEPGPLPSSGFLIFGQWHGREDAGDKAGSPPWAIEYTAAGVLQLSLRTTPLLVSPQNPPPTLYPLLPQVERGRWYRLVAMVCMDWVVGGKGAAKLWIDGQLLVDVARPIGYNDAAGPYFKFGIYRSAAPETMAIVYANMRIGPASLLGRVTRPLPLPLLL